MKTENANWAPNPAFMREAIALAKRGEGYVNPNPLVGAVLVKDNQIIASGYHHKFGELHAERDALRNCQQNGVSPKDSTLYVTLEPCCHFGKQPPCTQAIVEGGISKVVVGSRDPNPLVAGKGVAFLREHGIEVVEDFLRDECDALNFIFFHYIKNKTPYVALKYAMTADGKIATKTGDAKWISCEASREFSHALRNRYACILAGIGTILTDDPLLTCRVGGGNGEGGRNPVRVICDSNLGIPLGSKIVQTAKDVPTIVACALQEDCVNVGGDVAEKIAALRREGAEVLFCGKRTPNSNNIAITSNIDHFQLIIDNGELRNDRNASSNNSFAKSLGIEKDLRIEAAPKVDLRVLMNALAQKNLDSVLIEGGAGINFAALQAGIVQHIYSFVAPKIFGGPAPTPVGGEGVAKVAENFRLVQKAFSQCGDDVLIEYDVLKKEKECSRE